jgi:hypothetical protein
MRFKVDDLEFGSLLFLIVDFPQKYRGIAMSLTMKFTFVDIIQIQGHRNSLVTESGYSEDWRSCQFRMNRSRNRTSSPVAAMSISG